MFGSPAVFVTTIGVNPLIVTFVWPGNTGAAFTSSTVTIKLFVALRLPSLTTVVNAFVPGLCVCRGVHVITPLVLMLAFVTALLLPRFVTVSLYVSGKDGISLSVAVFVTVSNVSSFTTWLLSTPNTGPLCIACTVTVKLFVAAQLRIDQHHTDCCWSPPS